MKVSVQKYKDKVKKYSRYGYDQRSKHHFDDFFDLLSSEEPDTNSLKYVKPEHCSSNEKYYETALIALESNNWFIQYVEPQFIDNYDELVKKIISNNSIDYVSAVPKEGVFNLEETKREDLLNFIKSYQCNFLKRITDGRKCEILDQWLKDYEVYQKEQEAN